MIPFIIGLFMGGSIGFLITVLIIGTSTVNREREAYMEGFLAGQKGVQNE